MTVTELIAALAKYPLDAEVSVMVAIDPEGKRDDTWEYQTIYYPIEVTDSENYDPNAVGSSRKVELLCPVDTSHPYGLDI